MSSDKKLSNLCLHETVSVVVRISERPFQPKHGCYFARCMDATDIIYMAGFGAAGSKLVNMKLGHVYRLSNVRVTPNPPQFARRFPFSELRLQVTDSTELEHLPNWSEIPEITAGSEKRLNLVASAMVRHDDDKESIKSVQLVVGHEDKSWLLALRGPFYRQWIRSITESCLPISLTLKSVDYGVDEICLTPSSEIIITGTASTSNSSEVSSQEECPAEMSKKRKRDALESENPASDDDEEKERKKMKISTDVPEKTEDHPLSTGATDSKDVTINALNIATEGQKSNLADENLTTWQLGEDRVLVITTKEHFEQMAERANAHVVSRQSSLWTNISRGVIAAMVIALGGMYFIMPNKIVVFMSMANFFKIML